MTNQRNFGLDGLRGVAAVIVICHHFHKVGHELTGGGHLAVDFFFVLSGYVIARSYEPRLRNGLDFSAFTRARIVRLYPMYVMGAVLGVLHHLITRALGNAEAIPTGDALFAFVSSLFMLPAYHSQGIRELFPLNGPSWSLFFEMVINLLFAAFLFRAKNAVLFAVTAFAGLWLTKWGIAGGTINWGWGWTNWDAGLARVTYSFLMGVLFYRFAPKRQARESWIALLNFVVLSAALLIPVRSGRPRDIFFGLILSPLCVYIGTHYDVPARFRKACVVLGDISYPIYAVHFPIILFSVFMARRAGIHDAITIPTAIVGMCVLCYWLGARVDPPLREKLGQKLLAKPPRLEKANA